MDDVTRFRTFMVNYDLDEEKIAQITGYSVEHVKEILEPGKSLPRWLKLVLHVWEKAEEEKVEYFL